jgi:hypothetical protein
MKMTFEEWDEAHKPVVNHLSDSSSFDDGNGGVMFETYGNELDHVLSVANTSPRNVWTLIDGDQAACIVNGYHLVNRIGYFITKHPATVGINYEVSLED